jgi:hypothetical protein
MISPGLVEVLAQVSKEPHHIAICAGIVLLFHFTIRRLRISAPLVPPANEGSFVGLKYRLASRRNMGPFWGLLQTQLLRDATFASPRAFRAMAVTSTFLAERSGIWASRVTRSWWS